MRYFFTLFAIVFLLTSCNNKEDRSSKLIRDGIQKLYAAEFEEAMEIFQKSAKLNPKILKLGFTSELCIKINKTLIRL